MFNIAIERNNTDEPVPDMLHFNMKPPVPSKIAKDTFYAVYT
jgi:hypothetical protein